LEQSVSDNVRSYGFIAAIQEGSELPDLEELNEKLWEEKSLIRVNYEGTLVFADYSLTKPYSERSDIYGFWIGKPEEMDFGAFHLECRKYGLQIDMATLKPYSCIWYNGTDSPMDQLKKERFLKV
jgi:hypothetical protein